MANVIQRDSITAVRLAAVLAFISIVTPFAAAQELKKPEKILDVWSIALPKDGKVVAGSAGWWDTPGEIGVWNLETRQPLWRFASPRGVCSLAFSSHGKLLAAGSWTNFVKVYDWAANKQVADFDGGGVSRVVFSPNDELLASAAEQKPVRLWDMKKLKLHANLEGDLIRFLCVIFSPDGKQLLAGGGQFNPGEVNLVVVWDLETKQQIMKLEGHQLAVVCMTYSPDGNTIVTGSADRTIRFWDAKTGKQLKTLMGHTGWVEALVFTADGKTLISGGHDHTVRFWDMDTGMEKEGRITLPGSVRAIQLSPDGKSLFVGGGPKILKIVDAQTKADVAYLWNGAEAAAKIERVDNVRMIAPQPKVAMDQLPVAVPERPASRGWLIAGLIVVAFIGVLFMAVIAVALFMMRRST